MDEPSPASLATALRELLNTLARRRRHDRRTLTTLIDLLAQAAFQPDAGDLPTLRTAQSRLARYGAPAGCELLHRACLDALGHAIWQARQTANAVAGAGLERAQ